MSHLPQTLLQFIEACIPSYEAVKVLLCLAANPDREFGPEELVFSLLPVTVTVGAIAEYAALFSSKGLIAERNGRFKYSPSSSELERACAELSNAYNEKPVTLIRVIESRVARFS